MTTLDHAALRKAAEAATPGPWLRGIGNNYKRVFKQSGGLIADQCDAYDGSFIAAFSPAVALALLDELAVSEGRLRTLNELEAKHRAEWTRAKRAEAEVAALRAAVARVPEWVNGACLFCSYHEPQHLRCSICGHAADCVRKL